MFLLLALGNIVGPQFFLDRQAPTYSLGIGAMMCAFAIMVATGIAYYLMCVVENERRDKRYGPVPDFHEVESPQNSAQDGLTDKENHIFRYTY